MGNRVLRMNPEQYPLEKFLRVVFRDDDGSSVHANNVGHTLINNFIGHKLRNGIRVAGWSFKRSFVNIFDYIIHICRVCCVEKH